MCIRDRGSDDETYEKQVVPADEFGTSPKTVFLPDEMCFPTHPGPPALQVEYSDERQCVARPADACSSSETAAGVTVNDTEHQQLAGLSAVDDAEDTARKRVSFDMALQTADDDADDSNYEGKSPVSADDQLVGAEVHADGTAAVTESQKSQSVHHVEVPTQSVTEDSCNTENLLDSESSSTGEAVFDGELQNATSMLPASQSMQQESPVSSHDHDDTPADNNCRRLANIRSWLYHAIIHTAQVGIRIYAFVNQYAKL